MTGRMAVRAEEGEGHQKLEVTSLSLRTGGILLKPCKAVVLSLYLSIVKVPAREVVFDYFTVQDEIREPVYC